LNFNSPVPRRNRLLKLQTSQLGHLENGVSALLASRKMTAVTLCVRFIIATAKNAFSVAALQSAVALGSRAVTHR